MAEGTISYAEALLALGVMEVETVSRARMEDPDGEDSQKLAMTKVALDSMECLLAALFGLETSEVRVDLESIPPREIERAMQQRFVEATAR